MYVFFFKLFSHLDYYRILSRVPKQTLLWQRLRKEEETDTGAKDFTKWWNLSVYIALAQMSHMITPGWAGCGKSSPTIFLERTEHVWAVLMIAAWSKASDDKETLRQKTQESRGELVDIAGRDMWSSGFSGQELRVIWLFPLPLLPTSNLSAESIKLYLQTISRIQVLLTSCSAGSSLNISFLSFFFIWLLGCTAKHVQVLVAWPRIKPVFPHSGNVEA